MKMDIQKIYLTAPKVVQNLGISLQGYRQHKLRYGSKIPEIYQTYFSNMAAPQRDIRELQNLRLMELVKHASRYTPFYMDFFSKSNVDPSSINIENFSKIFPILEKSTIVQNPRIFHSRDNVPAIDLFTSGTSGSPMPIKCALYARTLNYAFFRKLIEENGSSIRSRSATFAGRILFGAQEKQEFWRKDFFNKTLLMSSYHISEKTIPHYIAALESWGPEYIDSYPSAIGEIARHITDNDVSHRIRPKFVLTSSETLSEQQRQQISAAFKCPIVDHYGCTEMAINVHSAGSSPYLVDPLYSIVEFEETTTPNIWSVICTGLLNTSMPLIRYRIGDVVAGLSHNADSPYIGSTFKEVLGREDDIVITPEGIRVGRLDPAFKGVNGIKLSQIIQTQIDELLVKVVPREDCDQPTLTRVLTANLRARTSEKMRVTIEFVDSITHTKSGKLRSVISLINRELM